MTTTRQRLSGGIWGALVGDALGVPYEFKPAAAIPSPDEIEFDPPPAFFRSHSKVPPGTWSDDGAQALCLLESLVEQGCLDVDDFAARMVRWYKAGHLAVDARVFDVGIQTSSALAAIERGVPVAEAGRADERGNGNGSLMRVLPLALWHQGTDAELVADAHLQSVPTHPHPRAQVCCALYCLWARDELRGQTDGFERAVATLRDLYAPDSPHTRELEFHIRPDDASTPTGSGYVVDTLRGARVLLDEEDSYEAVVRGAIRLGGDTDTTACVAGGIAGIRWGAAGIPERWMQALRGQQLVTPLLDALLARYSSASTTRSIGTDSSISPPTTK